MTREMIPVATVVFDGIVVVFADVVVNTFLIMLIPDCNDDDIEVPNHEEVVVVEFHMTESSCVEKTLEGVMEVDVVP